MWPSTPRPEHAPCWWLLVLLAGPRPRLQLTFLRIIRELAYSSWVSLSFWAGQHSGRLVFCLQLLHVWIWCIMLVLEPSVVQTLVLHLGPALRLSPAEKVCYSVLRRARLAVTCCISA